jgi:hypothetical protein
LIDYDEQQTWWQLYLAYESSTAGSIDGLLNIYNNSKSNGPYDYGYLPNRMNDTWTRCGVKMDADHFANYMAGFQGGAYDSYFFPNELTYPSPDIDAAGDPTGYVTVPVSVPFAQSIVQGAGILYHLDARSKARNDPFDRTGWPMIKAGEKDGRNFNPDAPPTCGCGH